MPATHQLCFYRLKYISVLQAKSLFNAVVMEHYTHSDKKDVREVASQLPKLVWDLITACARTLVRSPTRPHYAWTIRDAFSICRGVCMAEITTIGIMCLQPYL